MQAGAKSARDRAYQSMVVVVVKIDPDAFYSDCVVAKSKAVLGSGNRTPVITSSKCVQDSCLYDNRGLKATLLVVHGAFCLLATVFHSSCQAILGWIILACSCKFRLVILRPGFYSLMPPYHL